VSPSLHRRYKDLPFISYNGNPVLRSVVMLSCLYSSTQINLDLCSNYIIYVNYN
jgi:hypothetical protein